MKFFNRPVRVMSFILVGIGVILLGLNIFLQGTCNVALPLVFFMLGGAFFILAYAAAPRWSGSPVLHIPATFFLALGAVFLLNVLTGDWTAWAYAWLFIAASLGVGILLAEPQLSWPRWTGLVGWSTTVIGLSLFVLFGAIAGGLFIQIMAPILLILGGACLFWLRPEAIFPEPILRRLHLAPVPGKILPFTPPNATSSDQAALAEPLSAREIEVLRLVDQGLSNQQIAERLSIAPSTVKTHINNLYGKLGVETRIQAVNRARELSLLEP